VLARGGVPLGTNIYAAWSQLVENGMAMNFRECAGIGRPTGKMARDLRRARRP